MFKWAHIPWMGPIVAVMLAIGVLASVVTWVAGPSSGLLEVAKAGYLPHWFQHTNKNGMATHILLIQAVCWSLCWRCCFCGAAVRAGGLSDPQSADGFILYLIMYMLMFSAAIYLRFSQPAALVRTVFRW